MPATQRIQRKLAALAAVPLLVGLFVGCSATGTEPSKTPEAGAELTDQQEYEAWQLKFNTCLGEQGYDMPAPGDTSGEGVDVGDQATFEAVVKECRDEVGPGPGGTIDKKSSDELYQGILELNQCLRERGYDVEDPAPDSKTIQMSADVAPEDMQACVAETGGKGALDVR